MISALVISLWTTGIADVVVEARESYQNLLFLAQTVAISHQTLRNLVNPMEN
jgi:hypothetical protein